MPAKLVMSIFARNKGLVEAAKSLCVKRWGEIELDSGTLPFDFTHYYEEEFGTGLIRHFFAFKGLFPQDSLVEIKLETWSMEEENAKGGRRTFNIDPGLLTLERLVLATGKNYTHRIYLGKGVYGDLTLIYKKGGYQGLEWTYRDYLTPESLAFWGKVRRIYKYELKQRGYI